MILVIAGVFFLATLKSENWIINKAADITWIKSNNLLVNADFKNGFDYWKHDGNSTIIETNNLKFVCIKSNGEKQFKIFQDVNVVSGKIYKLSLIYSGPSKGGLAIYTDQLNKGKRFSCKNKDNKEFCTETFSPIVTGKGFFSLLSNGEGNFCYSKISLKKINTDLFIIYRTLFILAILITTIIVIKEFHLTFSCIANFIFVFLLLHLMAIPVIMMNNDTKSRVENRNLSPYKPLFIRIDDKWKINETYSKDIDSWLNDHFCCRGIIIKNFGIMKMSLNGRFENDFILPGKDKFYFKPYEIKHVVNTKNDWRKEYNSTFKSLKRLTDLCSQNDIDLFIIILPYSAEVYNEKLNGIKLGKYSGCHREIIEKLSKELNLKIIYPFEKLCQAKEKGLVYYKTDHHWSKLGGYIGYRAVIEEMSKKYKDLKPVEEDQYEIIPDILDTETYYSQLYLGKKYKNAYPHDAFYPKYIYKNASDISGDWEDIFKGKNQTLITNKNGYCKKLFLFGDSYIRNYYCFFTHTFYETFCYYKPKQIYMPDIEKTMLDYKPDIAVMNIYAYNFSSIKFWYREKR